MTNLAAIDLPAPLEVGQRVLDLVLADLTEDTPG